jgi:hypothetical protein
MKRSAWFVLSVVFVLVAMTAAVSAETPITEKITGGGHFTSDAGNTIGDLVYLSLVGMEKSGEWSGQGSYRDPAIGLEAHMTVDSGFLIDDPTDDYVCVEGSADVYVYDAFDGTRPFRVCIVDEGPSFDGRADRIGVQIDWPSYHYSHMGYSVTDHSGCIKIH